MVGFGRGTIRSDGPLQGVRVLGTGMSSFGLSSLALQTVGRGSIPGGRVGVVFV